MAEKEIALVKGDGSAPEMMDQAVQVTEKAASLDGIEIVWVETPMGWEAYLKYGDTTPSESMKKALEIGTIFFGGVGDPKYDKTTGIDHPEMKPEARALLAIRKELGLLLNFRPMVLMRELAHLSPLKAELIPEEGVEMVFIRFLLQDSYFGTADLRDRLPDLSQIGLKLKPEVTGDEDMISELSYYRGDTVRKYFCAAFEYALSRNLPLISIDKANVMARYAFWRKIVEKVAWEFPGVEFKGDQLVDSANMLLFHPEKLNGVIVCGNEHGDILSDGAAEMVGGMGLMHSSAVNPETGQAMFESGAGTAPTLAGQDKANPLGRILTGAMMLRHIGSPQGAKAIEDAVHSVLVDGYRTADIAEVGCRNVLSCSGMGRMVLDRIN